MSDPWALRFAWSATSATMRSPVSKIPNMSTPAIQLTEDGILFLTTGGIQKQILREGTGTATPPVGADVEVHYVGTLMDGTEFDSSRARKETFHFDLGSN